MATLAPDWPAFGPAASGRTGWPAATLAAALAMAVAVMLLAWATARPSFLARPDTAAPTPAIEREARRFVSLALTLGAIAPAEVDSYFGPGDIRPVARPSLPELRADLADLAAELRDGPGPRDARRARLADRTDRLLALVDTMGPVPPASFDEESARLYGLPRLTVDQAAMAAARARLGRLLPGPASLADRVAAFRQAFAIPPERRAAVFGRALAECRRRTLAHWRLPPSERVDLRWTTDVDAAWHRYRGGFRSTLQVNPQTVAFLGSAIQVACHEAYPGHHAQFALAELAAGPGGLPVEDRVVLLRSPASVLREGAAEIGATLAFSPPERLAFDRDVLMPLAGLPRADADRFEAVRALLDQLAPAAFPILRGYRDGTLDAAAAGAALRRDALVASPEALLAFADTAGAYLAGYTAVREAVRRLVFAPARATASGDPWSRLRCLLARADEAPLARADPIDPRCIQRSTEARP